MSTRLVILGLLQNHPMYGYELKSAIEDQMSDWTSIAFGSIYFALNKLAEEGLIEKIAIQKEGNRPSRTVYEITEDGKKEFMRLLRKQWAHLEHEYYDFDIALFFQEYLSSADILQELRLKIGRIKKIIQNVESQRAVTLAESKTPKLATNIFEHRLVHLLAELEWLNALKKRFPGG